MGRASKTVEVKVRVEPVQAEWLRARAEAEFNGNMSAALRQALTEARLLRTMVAEHAQLREEHPGYRLPRAPGGETTLAGAVLGGFLDLRSGVWEPEDAAS